MTAPTLHADLPCAACGYNLRGLREDANCPECNAAVASSMSLDRLCFSKFSWRQSVARGVGILWAYAAVSAVYSLLSAAISVEMIPIAIRMIGIRIILSRITLLALTATPWLGAWKIATPEPEASRWARVLAPNKIRSRVRLLATAYAAVSWMQLFPHFAFWLATDAVGAIYAWQMFRYIQQLCGRVPDQQLRELARWLMWALVLINALYASLIIHYLLFGIMPEHGGLLTNLFSSAVSICAMWFWPRLRRAILTA